MVNINFTLCIRQHRCIRGIRLHSRFIDQFKDPRRTGQGILQLCHHAGDFIKGLCILVGIAQEGCQLAYRQRTANGQTGTGTCHNGIHQSIHKTRQRVHQRAVEGCIHRIAGQCFIDLIKALLALLLMRECLDKLQISHHFIGEGRKRTSGFRLMPEQAVGLPRDKSRHQEGDRCQQHHQEGNQRIDHKHKDQGADDGHGAGEKLGKAHQKSLRELVNIGNHTAHQISRRMRIQIRNRQLLQMIEGLRSNVLHHTVGHYVIDVIHQPLAQCSA